MSDVKLGTLPGSDVGRDAVHIAIVPLLLDSYAKPGDHVGWADADDFSDSKKRLVSTYARTKFGIVDPFLVVPDKTYGLAPGTRVWVCLYSSSISSLRHVWSHPAFNDEPAVVTPKSEAEQRMRDLAESLCVDYEDFLEMLQLGEPMYFAEECYHLNEHEVIRDLYTLTGVTINKLPPYRCAC